jgi:putative peptidoglycan lipid II flippase
MLLLLTVSIAAAKASSNSLLRPGKADDATKRLSMDSLPLLASNLLMIGLPLLDQLMAGWLPSGSVAVLSYGEKICSIVIALIAGASGQALYPHLAELVGSKDWAGLRSTSLRYSMLIVGCSLPMVGIFWVAAPFIVKTLFQSGAFDHEDTTRVAEVLRCLALQIPFCIAAVLASRVILAMRCGVFMAVTTVVNLTVNTALNLILMKTMGVAGLALATAGVYLLSAIMLYSFISITLRRRIRLESTAAAPLIS